MKEIEEFRAGICGPYADVDFSIQTMSEYLSIHFVSFSEMIFSAVFKFETFILLNDRMKSIFNTISNVSKKFRSQSLSLKSTPQSHSIAQKQTPIETLLTLLSPWLQFNDFSKNESLIQGCPSQLRCFTVYTFLNSLLSLKCANPLSSSIAAVIAKMANSSKENALSTFCNLLLIYNNSKDNKNMKQVVLSALSLVLTVSSQTLTYHILSLTKVDAWYAFHTKTLKRFYSFKTIIRAAIEVLTELVREGSDDIIAQNHICLSFALIVYHKHPDQCENLIRTITRTRQHSSKQKQSHQGERIAEQLVKGIVYGRRSEQIQDWYSQFSEEITKSFDDLVTKKMNDVSTKQLIILGKKLLNLDPEFRLSPYEALSEDYFRRQSTIE